MATAPKSSINFQDLMLYRIHEILLVASPYDAFILEEDGRLTQQILYEYLGMNLSYAPRVWHADNASQGLKMLSDRSYDLVIVMMRIADMDPITFGEKVKANFPDKPVILLAFDESEITALPQTRLRQTIDKVFIWSGNANVFPAIIKNIEDYFINLNEKRKLKALVTAGPTREYIDPVRFITNKSSGKQGFELARSLSKKGFETTLISGPTNLKAVSYTHLTLPTSDLV